MAMNLTPLLLSPFTDLGALMGHVEYGLCADFEMAMMNCMEAYGTDRGKIKCKDLISDFQECYTQNKQKERETKMRLERHRQVLHGERSYKDWFAPPPKTDSY